MSFSLADLFLLACFEIALEQPYRDRPVLNSQLAGEMIK